MHNPEDEQEEPGAEELIERSEPPMQQREKGALGKYGPSAVGGAGLIGLLVWAADAIGLSYGNNAKQEAVKLEARFSTMDKQLGEISAKLDAMITSNEHFVDERDLRMWMYHLEARNKGQNLDIPEWRQTPRK